jgi:hypothetical protein
VRGSRAQAGDEPGANERGLPAPGGADDRHEPRLLQRVQDVVHLLLAAVEQLGVLCFERA